MGAEADAINLVATVVPRDGFPASFVQIYELVPTARLLLGEGARSSI